VGQGREDRVDVAAAGNIREGRQDRRANHGQDVSPKGIGSGIKMIQYFINRGGKGLSATRKKELHKAIKILQERQRKEKSKHK
jgi:hypothetical protein